MSRISFKLYKKLCHRLMQHNIELNVFNDWNQLWVKGPCFWNNLTEDNVQAIEDLTIEYANKLRELLNDSMD